MLKTLRTNAVILILVLATALPATFAQRRDVKAKATTATALLGARGGETITAAQMRTYLSFIAADEMEGRDTPSRGLDTVAKFIALNLTKWGFKPAGDDGTFFQKIALHRDVADTANSYAELGGQRFAYGDDVIRASGPASGKLSGQIVFAGNGWMFKSKNMNPYAG